MVGAEDVGVGVDQGGGEVARSLEEAGQALQHLGLVHARGKMAARRAADGREGLAQAPNLTLSAR